MEELRKPPCISTLLTGLMYTEEKNMGVFFDNQILSDDVIISYMG